MKIMVRIIFMYSLIFLAAVSLIFYLNCNPRSTTTSESKGAPMEDAIESEGTTLGTADSAPSSTDVEPPSPEPSKYLYITNQYFKTISKINLADFVLEKNLDFSESPSIVAPSSDGTFVVSFDTKTNVLAIIDSKTDGFVTYELDISDVIDIQLSPSDKTIYLLSQNKELKIIELNTSDFTIINQEVKEIEQNYQKMVVSENNVILYDSSEEMDSSSFFYYPAPTFDGLLLTVEETFCQDIKYIQFLAPEIDSLNLNPVIFCDNRLILFDLENNKIERTIDLFFTPEEIISNEDKTAFYAITTQNSANNLHKIEFIDKETETKSLLSISGISGLKYMLSATLTGDSNEHLFILDSQYLHDFDPILDLSVNKYTTSDNPLKIHYYKSSLFVTHDISIGHLLRINKESSASDELTGFALDGWFDR